ncbi:hypothetical protein OPAG_01888 [Rhodococcus opacus PD630]|nr:hypothetical protein Pd630_LPD07568 [Rhodococcus opacus PD630]EHI39365.1 hypothetical protein OPAG_01888 [Rhodococcus opacus PD630]
MGRAGIRGTRETPDRVVRVTRDVRGSFSYGSDTAWRRSQLVGVPMGSKLAPARRPDQVRSVVEICMILTTRRARGRP